MITIGICLELAAVVAVVILRIEYGDYMTGISFYTFLSFCFLSVISDLSAYSPAWHYCCLGFSVASLIGFIASAIVLIV